MEDAPIEAQPPRPAHALRALEDAVDSHVAPATADERRDGGRGRLVGVISVGDAERGTILLAHTGIAASRLLQRPVLLLDLTDTPSAPSHARELPGLAALLARPGLLAEHDAFARQPGAHLGIARAASDDGVTTSSAAIDDLLAELTHRYPLVIVHAAPEHTARATLAQLADTVIVAGYETDDGMLRRGRLPTERDVLVLRSGRAPATEGERRRLEDACRARVLRVVSVDGLSLVRDGTRDGAEPWCSIDWLARHCLQRKVGLALGGGIAGGYAHIGVAATLAAALPVDFLAASGIGAPVAAGFALGRSPHDLRDVLDDAFHALARPRLPWPGHGAAAALHDVLTRLTGSRAFEDLEVPLSLVATDLDRGEPLALDTGPLADAVLASMAIPSALTPVPRDGRRLVDGAALEPVPAGALASAGADVVIGVRLTPGAGANHAAGRDRGDAIHLVPAVRAFDLMQARIASHEAEGIDLLIEPDLRAADALAGTGAAMALIAAGRDAATAALPALRHRIARAPGIEPERIAA